MGVNIVKRRPPVRLPQPAELRQTAQLTERQLHELIFDRAADRFDHAHGDLEPEIEIVEALPEVLPDATPTSVPSTSSLRLAHTLRRDSQLDVRPAGQPAMTTRPTPATPPATLVERTGTSTTAMPRAARPANPRSTIPPGERRAMSATAVPRVSAPALATREAASSPITAPRGLPAIGGAPSEPLSVAGTPRRSVLLGAVRTCLVFLVPFLLTLGAATLLLQ